MTVYTFSCTRVLAVQAYWPHMHIGYTRVLATYSYWLHARTGRHNGYTLEPHEARTYGLRTPSLRSAHRIRRKLKVAATEQIIIITIDSEK